MNCSAKETFTLRNCIACLLLGAAIALAGCGGEEAEELSTESAQAALVSQDVTETLTPLYQLHGESANQLPKTFDKIELGEEDISALVSGIQALLDKATISHCGKAAKVDQRSYQVTFTNCSYGTQGIVHVDGAVTLTWNFDKTSKSASISTTFASFKVNEQQIDGEMKTTFLTGASRGELTMDLNLQLTDQTGKQKDVSLAVTIDNDILGGQVTVNGSGTVSLSGIIYSVTIQEMQIKYSEPAPYAGSVTLASGPLTVQVIFSEATVTDGVVTVMINNRDMGQWSWEELRAFLTGN